MSMCFSINEFNNLGLSPFAFQRKILREFIFVYHLLKLVFSYNSGEEFN